MRDFITFVWVIFVLTIHVMFASFDKFITWIFNVIRKKN